MPLDGRARDDGLELGDDGVDLAGPVAEPSPRADLEEAVVPPQNLDHDLARGLEILLRRHGDVPHARGDFRHVRC